MRCCSEPAAARRHSSRLAPARRQSTCMAEGTGRRWEIVPIGFELHKPHPAKTTQAQRVEQLEAVQVDALVLERRHPDPAAKRETSVVCSYDPTSSRKTCQIREKNMQVIQWGPQTNRLRNQGHAQLSPSDLTITFARQTFIERCTCRCGCRSRWG